MQFHRKKKPQCGKKTELHTALCITHTYNSSNAIPVKRLTHEVTYTLPYKNTYVNLVW